MPDQFPVEVNLSGNAGSAKLTFWITQVNNQGDPIAWSNTLVTINVKGKPLIDGMEFDLQPSSADENGFGNRLENQTWSLKGPNEIEVDDEDENPVTITIFDVALKSDASQNYMAKMGLEKASDVIQTDNWKD